MKYPRLEALAEALQLSSESKVSATNFVQYMKDGHLVEDYEIRRDGENHYSWVLRIPRKGKKIIRVTLPDTGETAWLFQQRAVQMSGTLASLMTHLDTWQAGAREHMLEIACFLTDRLAIEEKKNG